MTLTRLLAGFILVAMVQPVMAQAPAPVPPLAPVPPDSSPTYGRKFGRAMVSVERPPRIVVDNRTTGRIKVTGWDRNEVEARAISNRGDEIVIVSTSDTETGKLIFFKADYADLESSEDPTVRVLDSPPSFGFGNLQVHLEVNVPRHAQLEPIRVIRSEVEVAGIQTAVHVIGNRGKVTLKQVGGAHIFTRTGDIEIEGASGLVEIATTTGAVRVTGSTSAARIVAISGPVEVKCSGGRIDVATTQGSIDLVEVGGDVDAVTTTSSVRFTGRLGDGRYLLKSMSGGVEMMLPYDTEDFDAVLTTYLGTVESDFKLSATGGASRAQSAPHAQSASSAQSTGEASETLSERGMVSPAQSERRLAGRFGKGGPQLTLDSFEGLVRLTRVKPIPASTCK